MNIRGKVVSMLVLLTASNVTHAVCSQNNNQLTGLVGLDSSTGIVYANTTSQSNECNCTNVRFKPENTDTKMALSVLLAAKMGEKKVRIDLRHEDDCNSAYRVYIH